jgi:hypothetical protein
MLERNRGSALLIAAFAVLPFAATMIAQRIARYTATKGELDTRAVVVVVLLSVPVLTVLASRYVYARFTDPWYYGLSGVLRWSAFGMLLAVFWLLGSFVLPIPDRDGSLVPYVALRLLEFGALCLALAASFWIAFRGAERGHQG